MATVQKPKNKTRAAPVTSTKQSAKERREAAERRRRQQQQIVLGLVAVAVLALVVIAIFVSTRPLDGALPDGVMTKYTAITEKGYQGTTADGYNFIGAENAPVTIEMFSSFSCSACASWKQTYFDNIKDKIEAGNVKFVYIPITSFGSFESSGMAKGAICAGEQGKFWEMHDALFSWPALYAQSSNDFRRLQSAASQLGLDGGKFSACLNASSTQELLDKAARLAGERGVTATPTVFLDGIRIYPDGAGVRVPSLSELRGAIESKASGG